MLKNVKINEWACDNCHVVFYAYLDEDAVCPECGDPAAKCGEVTFIMRDEEFETLLGDVVQQKCGGCRVHREGTTNRQAEELANRCAVARLREALYKKGCLERKQ